MSQRTQKTALIPSLLIVLSLSRLDRAQVTTAPSLRYELGQLARGWMGAMTTLGASVAGAIGLLMLATKRHPTNTH